MSSSQSVTPSVRAKFKEAILELRGSKSQRAIAKELGVSQSTIALWESGEVMPGLEKIELVAAARGQTALAFLAWLYS